MIPKAVETLQNEMLIASDRIALLGAANNFVGLMLSKQEGVTASDLTEPESRAYNSALGFIERQFEAGYKDNETVPVNRYNKVHY